MAPRIYWVDLDEAPGAVAITQRPRPVPYLDEDVAHWKREGLHIVASLLDEEEAAAVGLERQREVMHAAGLELVSLPVLDHGIPDTLAEYDAAATLLADRVRDGGRIACHCFAGLGRSPTLAAGVLIRLGLDADEAVRRLSVARRTPVPEMPTQLVWIKDYATFVRGSGTR